MKKLFRYSLYSIILFLLVYYFWPESQLQEGQKVDKIVVYKFRREMILLYKNEQLATYKVSLGSKKWPSQKLGLPYHHPVEKKQFKDDNKTPEGEYKIDYFGKGKYQPSMHISYPNSFDKINAKRKGKNVGGGILIHGLKPNYGWVGKFHRWVDWTDGCIAVTNDEIVEISVAIHQGCKIIIYP
ncbi:MAG: murein L,D-transpeptidase family protein [Bacteroidota bacterium]